MCEAGELQKPQVRRRPGRDLLGIESLTLADTCELLAAANYLTPMVTGDGRRTFPILSGFTVINMFNEPSTRTRTSFELAGRRLGADVINFVGDASTSVAKGETPLDTALTLDAMGGDALVVRDVGERFPHSLTQWLRARIINAGDGRNEHPTQALLDALTILEALDRRPQPGALEGIKVAICGDIRHGRVAHSNMRLLTMFGAEVVVAGPPGLVDINSERFGVRQVDNLDDAVAGADAVMMLRIQRERLPAELVMPDVPSYHAAWGLNCERVAKMAARGIVMHPGPMNRGVEISDAVADGPRSRIRRQVTLGVAVRMAVLARACGVALPGVEPRVEGRR